MSLSLPIHPPSQYPQSSYSRPAVIAAVLDFYELLIKSPYIPPSSLTHPPPTGWSNVNAEILRRRGKTEEVIRLLRHLHYLRAPPGPGQKWMVGPDTVAIAYCDGEVYDEMLDAMQPVPGHCIWLTDVESRDGTGLLLDTETGTVTEWTTMEHKIMVDYDVYEKFPTRDRWMAHATLPAPAFFQLWKRNFERLVWMAVYLPGGMAGTAQWYVTATTPHEEEDMLASDDEFEPAVDKEGESEEEEESESDDVGSEEGQIPKEEADELMEDAFGEDAREKRTELLSQKNNTSRLDVSASVLGDHVHPLLGRLDRKTKQVYEIYTRNGWPSNFNREKCVLDLADFLEREEAPVRES